MKKMREIEFKKIVDSRLFQALRARFGVRPDAARDQVNYYFDTPGLALSRVGMALRVREKGGAYGLTLKVRARGGANEYALEPLSPAAFRRLKACGVGDVEVARLIRRGGVNPVRVRYCCRLRTARTTVPWEGGEICLDANRYGGRRDYELEYEVTDARRGRRLFEGLLREFGLVPDPAPVSKSRRALNVWRAARLQAGHLKQVPARG